MLSSLDERTAMLRLSTFGVADMDEYRERVDAAFDSLDADRLVIDLRGNLGGLRPNAVAVLRHLLDAPYHQWIGLDARFNRLPRRYRKRLTYPFEDEGGLAGRFPHAPFRIDGDPYDPQLTTVDTPYQGEVVVLVDGQTSSAANTLVLALERFHPRLLTVGEEVGGECAQHIGEFAAVYQAEDSPVAILHSLVRVQHVVVEGCTFGHGLVPDKAVTYTAEDFLSGRDPYLSALGIE